MERVRCNNCGEYVVKASGPRGIMDEDGVVTLFKMTQRLSQTHGDLSEGITCAVCGGHSFELVDVPQAADDSYEQQVEQEEKKLKPEQATESPHLKNAWALLFQGKGEDAIAAFRLAAQLEPRNAETHYGLASAYAKFSPKESASEMVSELETAIGCDPTHAQSHYLLGAVYLLAAVTGEQRFEGKFERFEQYLDEAERELRLAVKHAPDHADAHYKLGQVFWKRYLSNKPADHGLYDEAMFHYREAIKYDPEHTGALYELGSLEGEEDLLRRVLKVKPDHLGANREMAIKYSRRDEWDKVAEHARAVLAVEPNDKDARDLLSQANRHKMFRCFIATAAYGSPTAPDVIILRRFRDEFLLQYRPGKCLVSIYESISPSLATYIRMRPALRSFVRTLIHPLAQAIKLARPGKRKTQQ